MDKKSFIFILVVVGICICICITYYWFFRKSSKPAPPPKTKPPAPPASSQPNPNGKSILPSGYFLDQSGNTLVSDDNTHQAKIIQVTSSTYNGLALDITPASIIAKATDLLAVSKVEILNNGNLQFYKPDGTLPSNYIKVGGLNSYMKFDSSNVLSFYNSVNIKLWDINNGDYTYANPNGKNILTSGYFLDQSGNTLVSDDGTHQAKITHVSNGLTLVVTPPSIIPNGRDTLPVSKVEILYNGNLQFYDQTMTVMSVWVQEGGLNSYMKFDSSNVLSFYNSLGQKIWDMNKGSYEIISLYDTMTYAVTPVNANINNQVITGDLVDLSKGVVIPRKSGGSISDYNSISILNNTGVSINSITISNSGNSNFFTFLNGEFMASTPCTVTDFTQVDYNSFGTSNSFTANSVVKLWVTDPINKIIYSLPSWDPISQKNFFKISFPIGKPLQSTFSIVLDFSDLQMIQVDSNLMNDYTRHLSPTGDPLSSMCQPSLGLYCCCLSSMNYDPKWNPIYKCYTEDQVPFSCSDITTLNECPYNVTVKVDLINVMSA